MLPNPYKSVDPAPSTSKMDVGDLEKILLDDTLPLFQRYRAMFSLRNLGTTEAVKALAKGNFIRFNSQITLKILLILF